MGGSCGKGNKVAPDAVAMAGTPYVDDLGGRVLNIRKSELAVAYEGELFVLVTDMSGVTSMTKRLGGIHFSGIILKMRQLVTPIWEAYHAVSLETAEADNFTIAFRTPQAAIKAAMECRAQMERYNNTQPEDFRPIIGGYGVAVGTDTIKAVGSGKLYGEAMDVSFHLGEDVADDEILIDHKVYDQVHDRPEFKSCKFERREDKESGRAYYNIAGEFTGPRVAQWPYPQNPLPEFIEASKYINMLTRRAAGSASEREAIDQECRAKLVQRLAIVMIGLEIGEMNEKYGVMHSLALMDKIVKLITPILNKYHGELLEETVFSFKKEKDAVLFAAGMRLLFMEVNAKYDEKWQIPCKGIGVHVGDVLIMRGTDIHWGDPLNTASKVSEDAAEGNSSLCITNTIYNAIKGDKSFASMIFLPREVTVSKVNITCYILDTSKYRDPNATVIWDTDDRAG